MTSKTKATILKIRSKKQKANIARQVTANQGGKKEVRYPQNSLKTNTIKSPDIIKMRKYNRDNKKKKRKIQKSNNRKRKIIKNGKKSI